jgi:GNAT superfamily N-acetyltransferase
MIRATQAPDLPQLVALIRALAAHHDDAAMVSEASLSRDLFAPHPWMQILVAETGGALTGYLALTQLARLQWGQRGMDIHHLYVAKPHRGKGLGAALIAAAIEVARAQDCSYLTVSALDSNPEALAFYPKQGFHAAPTKGHRFALDLRTGLDG